MKIGFSMLVRTFLGLTILVFFPGRVTGQNACADCHAELEGRLHVSVTLFEADVHREAGLSCSSCHGGDPTTMNMAEAKSTDTGFRGVPDFKEIPTFCGSCHSSAEFMREYNPSPRIDQVAEYRTSVHGRRAAEGDTRVATCTSCHSVHDIRRVKDPASPVHPLEVADTCGGCHSDAERMKSYDVPHDQVMQYKESVHAKALYEERDLSAPTCNDCHGNHGAVPPGVTAVANVCGTCHAAQRRLYEESPHFEAFEVMGLSGCITCHENHAVQSASESMLAGDGAVCTACHESDTGAEAAETFADLILGLREGIERARERLSAAERAGMEVSTAIYELRRAHEKVIFARHEVHSLDVEKVEATVKEGIDIAEASYERGIEAFEKLRFRRRGLYISLFIIGFVIIGLVSWIRFIETDGKT